MALSLEGNDGNPVEMRFLVDTGFDGELSLPVELMHRIRAFAPATSKIQPVGAPVSDVTYVKAVVLDGDGDGRVVEVLIREHGGHPLVGTGFMWDHCLSVEFTREGPVALEEL